MKQVGGRRLMAAIIIVGTLALGGCGTVGYYAQAIHGQMELLAKRQPIQSIIDDPTTDAELRGRLTFIQRVRAFSVTELRLPNNGSYRSYADVQRPYLVWNVFAAPELSVEPVQWCFLFVGCLSYRGYFAEARAQGFAAGLADQGHDVLVAGIAAYSTLGWFDDPVPNTVLHYSDVALAGLIFHELAHQMTYIDDDSTFNESFATAVELEGARRWVLANGTPERFDAYLTEKRRKDEFIGLLMDYRARLAALYSSKREVHEKRAAKVRVFAELRAEYQQLKKGWDGYGGFDHWMGQGLNNARLISVGLYHQHLPGFQALLERHDGDLAAFYRAVEKLGRLPKAERDAQLSALGTVK